MGRQQTRNVFPISGNSPVGFVAAFSELLRQRQLLERVAHVVLIIIDGDTYTASLNAKSAALFNNNLCHCLRTGMNHRTIISVQIWGMHIYFYWDNQTFFL